MKAKEVPIEVVKANIRYMVDKTTDYDALIKIYTVAKVLTKPKEG